VSWIYTIYISLWCSLFIIIMVYLKIRVFLILLLT